MRILHVLYDHPKNPWLGGGGAQRAVEINELLEKNYGCKITMLCGGFPGCKEYESEKQRFTTETKKYALSRLLFNLTCRFHVKTSEYDLIVEDTSPFSFIHLFHKKKVAIFHYAIASDIKLKLPSPFGDIFQFYERLNISLYKNIVFVSKSTRETFSPVINRRNFQEAIIPPGGVPNETLFKQDIKRTHFLYVGRIEYLQKGLKYLLGGWKTFVTKYPECKLIIAGSGKDEEQLKSDIAQMESNSVEYIGRVGEEKYQLMREAHALLMPSKNEGWPIVLLEAFSVGTPVLASDIPGIRNVANESNSLMAKDITAEKFANLLTTFWENSSLQNKLSQGAFETSEMFTWDRCTEKTLAFYRSVYDS